MAEKRLRKRSTRQAEPDLEPFEDPPPKKRSRKQPNPPAAGAKSRKKQKNGAVSNSSSPASSVTAGRQTRGGKRGKRLLVSLNLQDNDLHVPGQAGVEAGVARRPASGRGGPGKGRGRPATQQERDQSVGSDGSSSNGSGGSGRPMAFKNPNFKVCRGGLGSRQLLRTPQMRPSLVLPMYIAYKIRPSNEATLLTRQHFRLTLSFNFTVSFQRLGPVRRRCGRI